MAKKNKQLGPTMQNAIIEYANREYGGLEGYKKELNRLKKRAERALAAKRRKGKAR